MERKQAAPQCFLFDHGEFYGQEVLHGLIFVSERQSAELELLRAVRPGDLLLHCSPRGISAVGRALSPARCVPVPYWRRRAFRPGERGYAVASEFCLLPAPVAVSKPENACLSLLEGEAAERLLRQISELLPELSGAGWFAPADQIPQK